MSKNSKNNNNNNNFKQVVMNSNKNTKLIRKYINNSNNSSFYSNNKIKILVAIIIFLIIIVLGAGVGVFLALKTKEPPTSDTPKSQEKSCADYNYLDCPTDKCDRDLMKCVVSNKEIESNIFYLSQSPRNVDTSDDSNRMYLKKLFTLYKLEAQTNIEGATPAPEQTFTEYKLKRFHAQLDYEKHLAIEKEAKDNLGAKPTTLTTTAKANAYLAWVRKRRRLDTIEKETASKKDTLDTLNKRLEHFDTTVGTSNVGGKQDRSQQTQKEKPSTYLDALKNNVLNMDENTKLVRFKIFNNDSHPDYDDYFIFTDLSDKSPNYKTKFDSNTDKSPNYKTKFDSNTDIYTLRSEINKNNLKHIDSELKKLTKYTYNSAAYVKYTKHNAKQLWSKSIQLKDLHTTLPTSDKIGYELRIKNERDEYTDEYTVQYKEIKNAINITEDLEQTENTGDYIHYVIINESVNDNKQQNAKDAALENEREAGKAEGKAEALQALANEIEAGKAEGKAEGQAEGKAAEKVAKEKAAAAEAKAAAAEAKAAAAEAKAAAAEAKKNSESCRSIVDGKFSDIYDITAKKKRSFTFNSDIINDLKKNQEKLKVNDSLKNVNIESILNKDIIKLSNMEKLLLILTPKTYLNDDETDLKENLGDGNEPFLISTGNTLEVLDFIEHTTLLTWFGIGVGWVIFCIIIAIIIFLLISETYIPAGIVIVINFIFLVILGYYSNEAINDNAGIPINKNILDTRLKRFFTTLNSRCDSIITDAEAEIAKKAEELKEKKTHIDNCDKCVRQEDNILHIWDKIENKCLPYVNNSGNFPTTDTERGVGNFVIPSSAIDTDELWKGELRHTENGTICEDAYN